MRRATGQSTVGTSERIKGMLLGSLIGDALGGPVEFLPPEKSTSTLPRARSWTPDETIDASRLESLAMSLRMPSYAALRPDPAPYGPWRANAPAGTITDDSRHKIVTMRALRAAISDGRRRIKRTDIASQFLAFQPHEDQPMDPELAGLVEEGLREYRIASRWVLGKRENSGGLPLARLWAGIANCSGQMLLPPIAALFPGQPEKAYRHTFAIDFVDAPIARDITSALNAGLAAALDPELDAAQPDDRWQAMLSAMRTTDPFRIADVPFAGRPLHKWLDLAESIDRRAKGKPAVAYRLLQDEGRPVYYWDAHFTLLVPLTMLRLCQFDPLATLHMILDFGHDTDSYAQVAGAMIGAVHGATVFPQRLAEPVTRQLANDYGEDIDDWVATLRRAQK